MDLESHQNELEMQLDEQRRLVAEQTKLLQQASEVVGRQIMIVENLEEALQSPRGRFHWADSRTLQTSSLLRTRRKRSGSDRRRCHRR